MVIACYHPYWGNSASNSAVINALTDLVAHGHIDHSCHSISDNLWRFQWTGR